MSKTEAGSDLNIIRQESQEIWNQNAEAWDSKMAEGNDFQRLLIAPIAERLLDLHPGARVLDIACGNGVFARRMAQLGAYVVASDFSEKLIELAKGRTAENADRIDYRVIDATDAGQLLSLGIRQYDATVCNMAIMDIPVIDPLFTAVSQLLKPAGRFVFAVMHPCFNSETTQKVLEQHDPDDRDGTYAIKISQYLHMGTSKGLAVGNQPVQQYYFHRPISVLLNTGFGAGFVLDGFEEPGFPVGTPSNHPFDWTNYTELPPVLIVRMRLPQ